MLIGVLHDSVVQTILCIIGILSNSQIDQADLGATRFKTYSL